MTYAAIVGAGEYRPETIRTNAAWSPDFARESLGQAQQVFTDIPTREGDPCAAIVARHLRAELDDPFVGAVARRVAEPSVSPAEAQALAAQNALADAGLAPQDIDVVLSLGFLPDRPAVPCASRVMKHLGMNGGLAFDVDNAHASALTQLVLATSLIENKRAKRVLLTQSHVITRAVPLTHRTSPNFGDLASALVLEASDEPGVLAHHAETHPQYADAIAFTRAGEEAGRPWWEGGGPFTLGTLDSRGTQDVIARTVARARDALLSACRQAGISIGDVRALCSVQPRGWIPASIAEAAGLDPARAPSTFKELAHVGSCGPVANLLEARRTFGLRCGDYVAFYAQGAGLTLVASIVRWTKQS